jgi:hypothetical protein
MTKERKEMKSVRRCPVYLGVAMLLSCALLVSGSPGAPDPGRRQATPGAAAQVAKDFGRLPLYFIENRGQVAPQVKFYQRGAGETIFFTQEGIGFSLRRGEVQARIAGASARPGSERFLAKKWQAAAAHQPSPALVQLTPVGMQSQVKVTPADPQEARFNYFLGNDPKKWQTDVPSYGAVVYREAYPGIDLKFYGAARQLEYDIIVRPGADPDLVKFHYAGIKSLTVTPTGDLAIKLPDGGELLQKKPVVYQEIAGVRVAREGKFRVGPDTAGHVYGFEVAAYDKTAPLIIDPALVYSSFLGGSNEDSGTAIAVDQSGCAYVAGRTKSDNLPTPGAFQPFLNGTLDDAFVAKVNAKGSALVFCTYFGGSGSDVARGLALGSDDSVYIAGDTDSANFPQYHNLPGIPTNNQKVFVTHLTAAGNGLVYSTLLGGSDYEYGAAIAVDGSGNAYITGNTDSKDFPVTPGAYQTTKGDSPDAFLTKLGPDIIHIISLDPLVIAFYPDILISTYLGGDSYDYGTTVALGSSGKIYLAGWTRSTNFPTEKAYQVNQSGGDSDAFVACFEPAGALFFSTYLGGTASDLAYGVAVDPQENIYVTGGTWSNNFPVEKAYQSSHGGGNTDAFVTKFRPPFYINYPGGGGYWLPVALDYSTYLGGTHNDEGYGIAVDSRGCAYVAGTMFYYEGARVVAKMAPDGQSVVYPIHLYDGLCNGIALDAADNVYVTGYSYNNSFPAFPIRNPFQVNFGGNYDAFVVKLTASTLPPLMLLLGE